MKHCGTDMYQEMLSCSLPKYQPVQVDSITGIPVNSSLRRSLQGNHVSLLGYCGLQVTGQKKSLNLTNRIVDYLDHIIPNWSNSRLLLTNQL